MTVSHAFTAMTGLVIILMFSAGCSKKPDAPVIVEPGAKAAPSELKSALTKVEATGTVKFEIKIDDPTARLVIDGNEYLIKELAEPMSLPIGEHTATLKLSGKELKPLRFSVTEGKRQVIELAEPNRAAAEWAFRSGAQKVYIYADGQERQVKNVAELPPSPFKVVWIGIVDKPVSDADMEYIEGLDSLHSLQLLRVPVTDVGLAHLRGLPVLNHLILDNLKITDAGLLHLKELPKLDFLDLSGTKITDNGLANLKGMNLGGLRLDRTGVTDAGLAHLSGMDLGLLNLWDTKITDAGLDHLKGMSRLRDLSLGKTKITDAGLAKLKALPALGILGLENTDVTDAGVADFAVAHPNCKVNR